MFETGMSALVLKICSEYAKSLGLNFPPCTQQEINAICEWVDKHAVKDMTISQDGYTVTFTFKGEYDTTKEFTITIPKAVDIDELEKVLKGSETVVVERTQDNSKLQVRLAQSVTTQINGKLDKPATPSAESAVVIGTDGAVNTKPLSEIGGGGKVFRHSIFANWSDITTNIRLDIIKDSNTEISQSEFQTYVSTFTIISVGGLSGNGVGTIYHDSHEYRVTAVVADTRNTNAPQILNLFKGAFDSFTDTVTEL